MRMEEEIGVFKNPDNLPVEDVTVKVNNKGIIQVVKALDPFWVEKRELYPYEKPPRNEEDVFGAYDNWMCGAHEYIENLSWLLCLEYHRFWSNVMYNPGVMPFLISYLQEAMPPYQDLPSNINVYYYIEQIHRDVFVVFSRLITNKEGDSLWMTKEFMASVIYEKYIFSLPIIWDLCLKYGMTNKKLVTRMVNCVFKLQPKYEADADTAVAFVKERFKYIIRKVNKNYDREDPPNLPETFKGFAEIRPPTENGDGAQNKLTMFELRDIILHLLDIAMTLRLFIEMYSKVAEIYMRARLVNSMVDVYENAIPYLYDEVKELSEDAEDETEFKEYLDYSRLELINTLREILAVYKNRILKGEGNTQQEVESYLTALLEGFSEKSLIRDYNVLYPIAEDIEILKQAYPEIDPVKTDFILRAIKTHPKPPSSSESESSDTESSQSSDDDNLNEALNGPSEQSAIPQQVKEESLINEVKDIMPDLGEGFILKCLKYYDFRVDRVVECLLENNLPESLRDLDRTLPLIPEDPLDKKFLETGVSRLNVFDGDEFDILTRDDVDLSRIHIGKRRSKYEDAKDLLDDKKDVKAMKELYNKYSLITEEDALYDDEYDDTYDVDGGVVLNTDSFNDDEERRPFVTPRALQTRGGRDQEESSEEEEQPSTSTGTSEDKKNRLDFCVNPEVLRAKREASYQARRGKGVRVPPPAKNKDVVGKPKGQGQEKEVLHNRDKKEKNKSSRANHNRRQGAQWKRSQGMMPS